MNIAKLKKVQEQCIKEGTSYKEVLKSMFTPGDKKQEFDKQALMNISLKQIAQEFLGYREWEEIIRDWDKVQEKVYYARMTETTGGGSVLGSTFLNISGYTDTTAGLLNALVMEGYNSIDLVAKSLISQRTVTTDGGKMIKVVNDGKTGASLAWGEPLPMVGLDEAWINLPKTKRYGNQVAIDQSVIIYDITGQVQEKATNAGYAVAYNVETDSSKVIMGITAGYSYKDTTNATYQTSGSGNFNFSNKETNPLVDWTDINQGQQLLEGNTDVATGFLISVDTPTILVMPQNELQAQTILRATEIISQKGTTVDTNLPLTIRKSANPVGSGYNLVGLPRLWYNLLNTNLSSATNAQGRWYLGDFKKAFQWLTTIPFKSYSLPLSGDDMVAGTVFRHACEEVGVTAVLEPRYAYAGTVE